MPVVRTHRLRTPIVENEDENSGGLTALIFSAMVAARIVGAAVSPALFAHAPALLIVLSPFLIYLVAVAPMLGPAIYFPVALVSATAQSVVGFQFGHTLGTRALEWLLERLPFPPSYAEGLLDLVRRASVVAIFAVPGPVLGTVAGVAGVERRTYYWLVVPSQALWVAAAYFAGEALIEYVELARAFVVEYALELTGITAALVVVRLLYGRFVKERVHRMIDEWKRRREA
jgi:membrane protein DedA with SNARE-associated domain